MIRYESDDTAVARAISALGEGEEIDHGTARTIASWFNDGGDTANYSFVSTGTIHEGDGEYLMSSFTRGVDSATLAENASALAALRAYVDDRVRSGDTDRVPGWSDMWVPKHVDYDYAHEDGALDTCWCSDPEESEF